MDVRLLKYALEIGRQQSFTKSANHLHIAQPSLSQQIAKLEEEIGITLFYRTHRSVIPTPEGKHFLEKAERIVQLHDDLKREMRERSEGIGQELTIGAPAITGEHILPPMLEAFKLRYPDIRVHMIEASPQALAELVAKGETDLAVLPLPIEDLRLTARTMLTEPILLATPSVLKPWMVEWHCDSLVKGTMGTPVPLAVIREAPFILLKTGYSFRQTVLELCAESGFQPRIALETGSIEMAQSLVAHGLGVSLIPAMVQRQGFRRPPRYYALAESPTRTLAFVYRKERYVSLSARALIDVFEQIKETYQLT